MPGLAVIIAGPHWPHLADALERMARALAQPDDSVVRLLLPEWGVALGHVGPARFAARQMTAQINAVRVAAAEAGQDFGSLALLDGEPLDLPAVAARLGLPRETCQAAVVAALYDRDGAEAITRLDGHWAVALADRPNGRVLLANDAFGIRPLFRLAAADGVTAIASHPAALLAYPGAIRRLNPDALADFLAFGMAWGRKTLFEGIELLPPASLLTFTAGQRQARRYWAPAPLRPAQSHTLTDLEAIRQLFNASVGQAVAAGGPFCLALTGGMDARLVLSALVAAGIRPQTMIHTIPGSTDALVSAELARVAGAEHHFFEVRGEDLPDQFRPGVRLLGGQVARPDVHPLCFLEDLKQFTHVMFTGHGGDLPRREYAATQIDPRRHTRADVAQALLAYYNRFNTMLSVSRDFPLLFSPDWRPVAQSQPARSIGEALDDVPLSVPLDDIGLVVETQEYLPKYWGKGDLIVRRELETRHPFVNRAFLERTWNLPKSARAQAVVHRYILTRNAPALAEVPYERDNLPLRHPFTRRDRWALRLRRFGQIASARIGRPYVRVPNYRLADWIRGPLRPLFGDVLLDERTLTRPYFREETVRHWFAEHMAGRDHATRLSVLLALELTIRAFVEDDAG